MTNFLVIFLCLVAGWLSQRVSRFPRESGRAFNSFVIYVSLPVMILVQFPLLLADASFDAGLALLAGMPWIVFAGAWGLFAYLGHALGWSRATTAALILTAGLGNTSFVGFPLLEALLGPQAIRYGVVVDQFGSFLVISLVGIPLAASYAGEKVGVKRLALRIVTFPPFLSVIFAGLWYAFGMPMRESFQPTLEKIAGTLVPLALFAVGFQIKFNLNPKKRAPLAMGLVYKLLIAPLAFFGIYFLAPSIDREAMQVTVLQAGMAPMITAAIVASEFDLDSELANLMVAVGIPLSLLTVPLLHQLF